MSQLKVEAGKRYLRRNGTLTEALCRYFGRPKMFVSEGWIYGADGRTTLMCETEFDLVEEYNPPVSESEKLERLCDTLTRTLKEMSPFIRAGKVQHDSGNGWQDYRRPETHLARKYRPAPPTPQFEPLFVSVNGKTLEVKLIESRLFIGCKNFDAKQALLVLQRRSAGQDCFEDIHGLEVRATRKGLHWADYFLSWQEVDLILPRLKAALEGTK